MSQVVGLPSNS